MPTTSGDACRLPAGLTCLLFFPGVSICTSFVGISWALLDYHRALRTCLPAQLLLGPGASVIYFLWNLLLLWPRVLVVALFSALFPRYVALHFLGLWLVFLGGVPASAEGV